MSRKSKAYHHGNLRNALIEGALSVIEDKGVEGLSLREVAREIGVSHTAPYRHFPDKMDLLAAIAEGGFVELKKAFEKALSVAGPGSREQLVCAGIAYVEYAVAHPEKIELMFGTQIRDTTKYPALRSAGEAAFSVLVKIIERGQVAKVFRNGAPLEIAIAAWSVVHGASTLFTAERLIFKRIGAKKPSDAAQIVGKLLFEGISRK